MSLLKNVKRIILFAVVLSLSGCLEFKEGYKIQNIRKVYLLKNFQTPLSQDSKYFYWKKSVVSKNTVEDVYSIESSYAAQHYIWPNDSYHCGNIMLNPYLTVQNRRVYLHFKWVYVDQEWLFIKSMRLYTSKGKYDLSYGYNQIKTDIKPNAHIVEKFDSSQRQYSEFLQRIAYEPEPSLRLYGERICTYTIPKVVIDYTKAILSLYNSRKP